MFGRTVGVMLSLMSGWIDGFSKNSQRIRSMGLQINLGILSKNYKICMYVFLMWERAQPIWIEICWVSSQRVEWVVQVQRWSPRASSCVVTTTSRERILNNNRDLDGHGRGKEILPETRRPAFISTMSPDLSQSTHRLEEKDTLSGILFLGLNVSHLRPKDRVYLVCKPISLFWVGMAANIGNVLSPDEVNLMKVVDLRKK